MSLNNTLSQFRKARFSFFRTFSFISLVTLILFISTANVYSAQVKLTWNSNTEADLAGYKIYYGSSSENYDNSVDAGNEISYTLSGLVEGATYYIVLTAYDINGNESGYSSELIYTVPLFDTTTPSIPANLQAIATSSSQINLSWNASTDDVGVTRYRIYRDATQIATTTGITYQDTGLSPSTAYRYTISAIDGAGNESIQSSSVSATTLSLSGNNPPVLDPISDIFVTEGVTVTLNPTATDPDGDALTYTYSGWMTSASYTTSYGDAGVHTVTVTVSDGSLTDSQDVMITVLNGNGNSAPVLDPISDIFTSEGATVTLNPTATDPDGDALTYTYSGWMTSASYTTGYQDAGIHMVTVTVSDGSLTDSQDVTITVNDDPNQVTSGIPVTWVDTVGVTVNGNSITKNASRGWGNSGAASLESFTGDGGVEFLASQTNTYRMCGLSSANPDASYTSIEYAIYLLIEGQLRVYESGVNKGDFGSYKIGDRFTVERVGSTIVHKKNDAVFYTSVTPTDAALMADCSIYNDGGEISDAIFIDITPGAPDAITDLTAATGNTEVHLNWTAPGNNRSPITEYEVQYGIGNFDTIFTDDTTPGVTITGLTNGVEYQFRVVAKNAIGTGSASNVVNTTPVEIIPVTWVDTVGVTVNGNSITKTASIIWGNSGAASLESFAGDGGVEFLASQTNTYRMCGLSSANPDASYTSIEYAIYLLTKGQLRVYESGVSKGDFGSYKIGDRFTVERVGSTIVYKKNDAVFYTSVTPTDAALMVDCSIYNDGGEISDAIFINITPGAPNAITDLTAATGNTEVHLNWTAPGNNRSPITEYEVQYGIGNFDTIFTDDTTPGVTITGLTNGVEYQFRVVAKNAIGAGSASNVVNTTPVKIIPFTWVDTVGVTVNGNSITKNASRGWGNSGAASLESFTGDGGVEFLASQTNTYRMCGLSSANPDASYTSIEYAIYLHTKGQLRVYESGVSKGNFGSYKIGDRFTAERVGSTIVYKKNDAAFYTSVTPTDAALMVDCSIYNDGGEISDAIFIDITPGAPDAITDLTAATGNTEVHLNWTAPGNNRSPITEYEVQYGTVSSGNFDTIFTDDATPGVTITGLTNGVEYQFRVVVKNAIGTGSASNVVNTTPVEKIPVTWVDTVGVTVNGNSITKNASRGWGNSGAASLESFTGDGGVEFLASQTNTYRMCGLSSANPDASYTSIEYAIYLHTKGQLRVYESGVSKGNFGSYKIGDRFTVERVGSTIVYKKNDAVFYTSVTPTDAALMVDCSIYNDGGEISDVKLIGM